jgi:hypothetical protein
MENDLEEKNGRRPKKKGGERKTTPPPPKKKTKKKMENNIKKKDLKNQLFSIPPKFRGKPFLGLAQLSKIFFSL